MNTRNRFKYVVRDLFIYARSSKWEFVTEAITNGIINVTVTETTGLTLLEIAIDNGDSEAVLFLLENNADANYISAHNGSSALFNASYVGVLKTVIYLIRHGANIDSICKECGRSPLSIAITNHHISIIKYLTNIGASKEIRCNAGNTPLMIAVIGGFATIVKFLLGANCDYLAVVQFSSPLRSDVEGDTCLHLAARRGHLGVVQCLISTGMLINQLIKSVDKIS